MSVGTWIRFSAVLVRSLYRRPHSRHRKRRKPCTVRPFRSVVADEWQCGQFMTDGSQLGKGRDPIRQRLPRQAALKADETRTNSTAFRRSFGLPPRRSTGRTANRCRSASCRPDAARSMLVAEPPSML
jgi:hypothetical protein